MGVSRKQVVWVYRTFLRRDPENEDIVAEKMLNYDNRIDLILSIMESNEFKANSNHGRSTND